MRDDDFLSELRQDDFELYVQNILPGPLVLPDLNNLTLQKWETADLSVEDRDVLLVSKSLRIAVKKGFLRLLTAEEYEEQTDLYEERIDDEYDDHLEEVETASGLRLDAEVIDLSSSSRAKGKTASKTLKTNNVRDTLNNPEYYAKKYKEAVEQYGVTSPEEFSEMIENNEIPIGKIGRKVKAAEAFSPEEYARKVAAGEIEDPTKPELRMKKEASSDEATVMTRKGASRVKIGHYDDEYEEEEEGIERIDLEDE